MVQDGERRDEEGAHHAAARLDEDEAGEGHRHQAVTQQPRRHEGRAEGRREEDLAPPVRLHVPRHEPPPDEERVERRRHGEQAEHPQAHQAERSRDQAVVALANQKGGQRHVDDERKDAHECLLQFDEVVVR